MELHLKSFSETLIKPTDWQRIEKCAKKKSIGPMRLIGVFQKRESCSTKRKDDPAGY
jgi:hypothetical protein